MVDDEVDVDELLAFEVCVALAVKGDVEFKPSGREWGSWSLSSVLKSMRLCGSSIFHRGKRKWQQMKLNKKEKHKKQNKTKIKIK